MTQATAASHSALETHAAGFDGRTGTGPRQAPDAGDVRDRLLDPEDSTTRAHALIEEARKGDGAAVLDRPPVALAPLKASVIGAIIIGIFMWQRTTPISYWTIQDVQQGLYYLPCLLAAMIFGLPGALAAALLSAGLTAYHVVTAMGGDFFGACLCRTFHIGLLLVTSVGAGWLFDQSAKARRRAEFSRDRLNEASRLLMETSSQLTGSLAKIKQATLAKSQVEEQLRRAERLNALGKLSAGLAHEIRNPLASIRGSTEILLDRASGNPTIREFVGILQQETERLNQVLTQFLSFAQSKKDEAGPSDVREIMQEVESLVRRPAQKAQVKIEQHLDEVLPLADVAPIHLRQVLVNLMLNAVQALSESAGDRRLAIGACTQDVCGGSRDLRLIVADSGPGIPDTHAQQIFDPFFTTKDDGTGLGLAIVDRIVRDAKGEIALIPKDKRENALPRWACDLPGACFVIDLPSVTGKV